MYTTNEQEHVYDVIEIYGKIWTFKSYLKVGKMLFKENHENENCKENFMSGYFHRK